MKIGALTAPKADLPLEKALDFFAEAGVDRGCPTVSLGGFSEETRDKRRHSDDGRR